MRMYWAGTHTHTHRCVEHIWFCLRLCDVTSSIASRNRTIVKWTLTCAIESVKFVAFKRLYSTLISLLSSKKLSAQDKRRFHLRPIKLHTLLLKQIISIRLMKNGTLPVDDHVPLFTRALAKYLLAYESSTLLQSVKSTGNRLFVTIKYFFSTL